ncbi:hypothetical protein E3N88_22722 [Mikania micrantha]|uniref:Uncharacterized protein n=1 Tax=Mikania micrantha TaxID=192012 RepID=A0A5N6NB90_9ASTR|nr:hypothetical protein E3N88_22722 [Mikania micrantha]
MDNLGDHMVSTNNKVLTFASSITNVVLLNRHMTQQGTLVANVSTTNSPVLPPTWLFDTDEYASLGSSSFSEFHDMDDHISQGSSCILEIDLIPSDSIYHLRCIAERMITAKYFHKCVQVYGSTRKYAVDTSFKKFGVKILSIVDIESLKWEALNAKIGKWKNYSKFWIYTMPC